ncbi:Ribonuclease P protein subunit rpr2 [Hypsizygus marmoreus]|uniref:Ribonuclease P protein subunit rpr2 n=1 Tax=Hypsizygus marmoreus TaxID=39966 RepID=A0A369J3S5_HYPMA|nr:Ribonuclease P protein subunit rpr2 [Hypsizygus marmoreus]
MAKKGKDEAPNPNSVTNRDIIQRLNFLYQASVYLSTVSSQACPPSASTITTRPGRPERVSKKRRIVRNVTTSDLAKSYISSMKIVGQKTTVKIDPAVKRTLCKGCNMTLIPGTTASVRVKQLSSHGHVMVYTCNDCKTSRRIPAPPTLISDVPSHPHSAQGPPPEVGPDLAQDAMVIEAPHPGSTHSRRRRRKKAPVPRLPPLFARDAGHVVFCGNERLPEPELDRGNGIFIT